MVEPGNNLFWRAFQILSRMRRPSPNGGLSDILLVDVLAHADLVGIKDRDIRGQLCRVVAELDAALLNWLAEQKPKPKPEGEQ